ncbi:MAG TPA: glycosyl hydrolase family 65 protein [Solirubrobacteraceae bacterium]|nr:glycosyl hydrolase family 65 protein [Solirubrobacteraceae bacterium]
MITHPAFPIVPWALRETELRLGVLAQSESLFALSNGHIGLRGTLDEGEPVGVAGTYLNGFHEVRPLPYAESAYGNPEAGETVVNVTDGKLLRLMVDDELFDVRYGELLEHERTLDFRAGVLRRRVHWRSPVGCEVRIASTRLVSLSQRTAAAILYEVEAVGDPVRLVVQSELVANADGPPGPGDGPVDATVAADPRGAAALRGALVAEQHYHHEELVLLMHRARRSGLRMAAAMDHEVEGPEGMSIDAESSRDVGRVTIAADIAPGQRLRVVKFLAYGWSGHRSQTSVGAQVRGSLAEARHTGWEGLCAAQRAYLDGFWRRADVEVDGDAELQQAVRFCLFHVLQAGARAERRPIAAKGLTGPGYDGHAFWDTESFVLPVLTYTAPEAARDALRWRCTTLALARERARQLGLEGAAFPWRTIAGRECSGYWPASTAAFHVNADIADAVVRYQQAAGDVGFECGPGLELLVETARLWRSLGHHDQNGGFRIDGVTGPDEYTAITDNNVYTNLMARRNLEAAATAAAAHPPQAEALGVDPDEIAAWRAAAARMVIPYDERLGVHPQADEFTDHAVWDFASTPPERYPLLLHYPYFDLYRRQVVKQADLVLALYACGDAFSAEQKVRDFEYYEPLTVRDSSLSACTQAIVAAETGHLGLAYDYLGEAALMDLQDRAHNTRNGLHIASLAGSWLALVAGFGGMRDHGGALRFAPRLPAGIERLTFRVGLRGCCLAVEVRSTEATYRLVAGERLEIAHHGEPLVLSGDEPQTLPIEPVPERERPRQPPGREPAPRAADRAAARA